MAQLTDDCFAFGGPMLGVEEAQQLLAERLSPVDGTERLPLMEADGRILAHDLVAPQSLPPFTNSAVDGYAIGGDDLPSDAEGIFRVAGRLQAGADAGLEVSRGEAVRIFTGAAMPKGADTVFMQEDVRVADDGTVALPAGLKPGANVRPAGEDIVEGERILAAGHLLRPQDVALAAALGLTGLEVRRRLKVAVFSTGNEIVAPGQPRLPSQLYDSNRYMLAAMLKRLGCSVSDLGILPDDADIIAETLRQAASGRDLILTSGGVSAGEADLVRTAVDRIGRLHFWRVAIKPGRPVAMGTIDGAAFMGLPGNPVASFVTFAHLVRSAVAALSGALPPAPIALPVRADFSYKKKAGRREYVRVHLDRSSEGKASVRKFRKEGAGMMSSLTQTDGLVELGEDIDAVRPGDQVRFFPYSSLF
ncbi:Molybdopterin molybdenumtransferase [Hartmannibacter diazotrophicus]|uniref:Molybdopterin molybdenumtransferase n=1 Tax=Hartmannibacter diazotrophicus TaxID=1482074 RepID=A0A2C9D706_9HYPH|nr:gephyrin-like molybdotransferase Glp [Hartmannibacter diazotrophicus]SON55305.1 Molybdopterin molybdenumtransferase [Hartmannibacter diazotrophicus]